MPRAEPSKRDNKSAPLGCDACSTVHRPVSECQRIGPGKSAPWALFLRFSHRNVVAPLRPLIPPRLSPQLPRLRQRSRRHLRPHTTWPSEELRTKEVAPSIGRLASLDCPKPDFEPKRNCGPNKELTVRPSEFEHPSRHVYGPRKYSCAAGTGFRNVGDVIRRANDRNHSSSGICSRSRWS